MGVHTESSMMKLIILTLAAAAVVLGAPQGQFTQVESIVEEESVVAVRPTPEQEANMKVDRIVKKRSVVQDQAVVAAYMNKAQVIPAQKSTKDSFYNTQPADHAIHH